MLEELQKRLAKNKEALETYLKLDSCEQYIFRDQIQVFSSACIRIQKQIDEILANG